MGPLHHNTSAACSACNLYIYTISGLERRPWVVESVAAQLCRVQRELAISRADGFSSHIVYLVAVWNLWCICVCNFFSYLNDLYFCKNFIKFTDHHTQNIDSQHPYVMKAAQRILPQRPQRFVC